MTAKARLNKIIEDTRDMVRYWGELQESPLDLVVIGVPVENSTVRTILISIHDNTPNVSMSKTDFSMFTPEDARKYLDILATECKIMTIPELASVRIAELRESLEALEILLKHI